MLLLMLMLLLVCSVYLLLLLLLVRSYNLPLNYTGVVAGMTVKRTVAVLGESVALAAQSAGFGSRTASRFSCFLFWSPFPCSAVSLPFSP